MRRLFSFLAALLLGVPAQAQDQLGTVIITNSPAGYTVKAYPAGSPPAAFMPVRFTPFVVVAGPTIQFDANGIPQIKPWSDPNNWHYSPTTIAQWGLGGYARGDYTLAFKAADWLVANQDANGGFALTFNHSVSGGYSLTAPWYSGLTQGNAISLLVRTWKVSGNPAYLDAAEEALHLLAEPVAKGGVKGTLGGGVWFEETPDPAYPNHIFNGSVFALLGVHDLATIGGDADALALWTAGEASLRANINAHISWLSSPPQDSVRANYPDPWMVYDLQVGGMPSPPNYVGAFYGRVHCELIEEMAARTGHATYSSTATVLRARVNSYIAGGGQ